MYSIWSVTCISPHSLPSLAYLGITMMSIMKPKLCCVLQRCYILYRVVQNKPHIVVIEPGAKVNSQYYCRNVLGDGLLPDIRAICQHHTWTLQQDGAPSHTAKNTMEYLRR